MDRQIHEGVSPLPELDAELLPMPDQETEWWYYAGRLHGAASEYNFHFTYFRRRTHRSRVAGWFPVSMIGSDVRFAHLSLTDRTRGIYRYAQRRVPGVGNENAGESGPGLRLWLGPWRVDVDTRRHRIRAAMDDVGLDLSLEPAKPLIRHVNGGQVHKGPSAASTHLSLPRMRVSGQLTVEGKLFDARGEAWMDREFGTFRLCTDFGGWRWLALQLEDSHELMIYRLVNGHGTANGVSAATWVDASGRALNLEPHAVECTAVSWWESPTTGIRYDTAWRVEIAELGLALDVSALLETSEIDARPSAGMIYWEGALRAEGRGPAGRLRGHGFGEQVVPPASRLAGLYDFGRENLGLRAWLRNELLLRRARRGIVVLPAGH